MTRILVFLTFFCTLSAAAQPFRASEGREPIRGEVIVYPTLDESIAAGKGASKYLSPLDTWTRNMNTFTAEFTYPFAWANRQILLHIGSASSEYELLVNGQSAGFNANPNAPADFNITKLSNEGRNQLEIRLANSSDLTPIESWKQNPSPALGRTYLLCQPTMRIRDVVVKTWPVAGEMNAEVGVIIRSSALNPKTSRIYYELRTPSNEVAASGHKDFSLDMRREDTLRFVTMIPDLLQWKQELPTQYTLLLKTQYEGRYVEYLRLKLGFRTIEMRGGQMLVNGQPVTLRTKEVSPQISENEIALLREQGYNTLKLRPGPVAEELFDSCDMLGMYVIVQAPIDSRSCGSDIRRGGNPTNDPAWLGAYLERPADTYHASKRHPSVIAFSIAEKSANGFNLYESYLNLKTLDEVRPFIYRDVEGQWNSDALDLDITPEVEKL